MPDGYTPQAPEAAAAKPAKDILAIAKKRYDACVDAYEAERELQKDDAKFYAGSPDNGWQWPDDVRKARKEDPNGARPCLTINKERQHVRHITNEQRQNRPQGKVLPVDSLSDPEVADMLNGLCRHIEYQSDADTAYDTACESQVVRGEGYWRILTEYIDEKSFDQDIFIRRIPNPECVYLDPDIKDPAGSDAKYGFITDTITETEFKELYPGAKPIDWQSIGSEDNKNWYVTGEKKVVVAEYFYLEYEEVQVKVGTKTRTARKPVVHWCKLSGQEELKSGTVPGRHIPIVIVEGNADWIDGVCHRSGIIRNTKDSQRMYNYWSSQETELLALAPKAPYVGAAGQFENHEDKWKKANVTNYAYLEYEPVVDGAGNTMPPPQRSMPPMPSAGILQAKLGAADDMKSETGQYDPSLGNNPKSQSGVALQREQKKSEVANFHYIDNLSRSIRHSTRIIIGMIPEVYDVKRVARILGEDGTPDQVVIDPAQQQPVMPLMDRGKEIGKIFNPSIGRYDVTVTVGPSYTTQRQEAAQMLTDLATGATDPTLQALTRYLAVKNMDFSGAKDLASGYKKLLPPGLVDDEAKQGQFSEEQAKAQIQQLQQALQQKDQEVQEAATQIQQEKEELEGDQDVVKKALADIQSERAAFKAEQEQAKLQKQIDLKDIELKQQKAAEQCANAERIQTAANEGMNSLGATADSVGQLTQSIQQLGELMVRGFSEIAQLVTCERESELEMDDEGNPVKARSKVVMPEMGTMQ